ncbi:MAG: hypothetical protein JWM05_1759, partial [Acidimicrobiales bacterium]|nr:hypothetical protein [Acidimicrobiales bacterium]
TALAAAASVTERITLGAMVFCNDLRHPAVLAKEIATLDELSGGRMRVALGAGWMTEDYAWSGIALDPPGRRIDRLAEAVTVMKGLLSDGPITFHGTHYDIDGLEGWPKPVQRPHPPIVMGGGGRRMLSLAAREADVVGINVSLPGGVIDASVGPDATAEQTDRKVAWIREAAGSRLDELTIQVRVHVAAVTDDRQGMAELIGAGLGLGPDQALESPFALAGDVDLICDTLQERRERWGISEIGISMSAAEEMAPVVGRLSGT